MEWESTDLASPDRDGLGWVAQRNLRIGMSLGNAKEWIPYEIITVPNCGHLYTRGQHGAANAHDPYV